MSTSATDPYIQVFTTNDLGSQVYIQLNNQTSQELNPMLVIYSNIYFQVYRNDEYLTNTTERYIMEVIDRDRILINSEISNIIINVAGVSTDSLIEDRELYGKDYVDLIFNIGVATPIAGVFLSFVLVMILRRYSLG